MYEDKINFTHDREQKIKNFIYQTKVKKYKNIFCSQSYMDKGTLIHCLWEYRLAQPLLIIQYVFLS